MRRTDETADRVTPRSPLLQKRSRARQQALLDAAEEMIAEKGLDGLAMREIGRRAGVPIASLYHYFPSAPSIVRHLAVRQLERLGSLVAHRLESESASLSSIDDLQRIAVVIVTDLSAYLEHRPAAPAIWNALRANPDLRALDRDDTAKNARRIAPYLARVSGGLPLAKARALATVILETVSINLMVAAEMTGTRKRQQLDALCLFLSAAIGGLSRMDGR